MIFFYGILIPSIEVNILIFNNITAQKYTIIKEHKNQIKSIQLYFFLSNIIKAGDMEP